MQEIIVGMSGLDRIIFQTNINGDPQILMGILWDSQDLKQPNLSGCSYQGCVCVFICQLLLRLWGRWTWIRLVTAVWAAPKSRAWRCKTPSLCMNSIEFPNKGAIDGKEWKEFLLQLTGYTTNSMDSTHWHGYPLGCTQPPVCLCVRWTRFQP